MEELTKQLVSDKWSIYVSAIIVIIMMLIITIIALKE